MRLWSLHPKYYYIAGIIDGEGCLSIKKNNPNKGNRLKNIRYYISINITNKNKQCLDLIASTFKITTYYDKKNDIYKIEVNDRQAYNIIKKLWNLLIIKRKQARLLKNFYEFKRANKNSQKNIRTEYIRKYYHNKAKRFIKCKTVALSYNKKFLGICQKYYNKAKQLNSYIVRRTI